MLKHASLIAAPALLLLACSNNKSTTPALKPNILFILADDLGAHDLSSTGSSYYETHGKIIKGTFAGTRKKENDSLVRRL